MPKRTLLRVCGAPATARKIRQRTKPGQSKRAVKRPIIERTLLRSSSMTGASRYADLSLCESIASAARA